jgi:hypothetical protein
MARSTKSAVPAPFPSTGARPTKERLPATRVLERTLSDFRGELTLADAATRGGLALRDAERGMLELVADYRGHVAATDKGELLFRFPQGLVARPETSKVRRALRAVGRAVRGVGRFLLRAWVSVVMVGYALVFALVLLALLLRSDDNRDDGPGAALGVVLRAVAEALYWTFHPFSPVFAWHEPSWVRAPRRRRLPFYERVNRFVFGPPPPPEPEDGVYRQVVMSAIRAGKGRIALGDVLRVTGLPADRAEALVSQLLVDAEGEIDVSEAGALYYRFPRLRQTTGDETAVAPAASAAALVAPRSLPPLTGNEIGTNVMLVGINAFNLVASGAAIANDLTLGRLQDLFTAVTSHVPGAPPVMIPPADGAPLVLGWIPFLFSAALFAVPVARALRRPRRRRKVEQENGRRALIPLVLGRGDGNETGPPAELPAEVLANAWARGAGRPPTEEELRDAARSLGGELELPPEGSSSSQLVYRFADRARERAALAEARAAASAEEARAGAVVFASDEPLPQD